VTVRPPNVAGPEVTYRSIPPSRRAWYSLPRLSGCSLNVASGNTVFIHVLAMLPLLLMMMMTLNCLFTGVQHLSTCRPAVLATRHHLLRICRRRFQLRDVIALCVLAQTATSDAKFNDARACYVIESSIKKQLNRQKHSVYGSGIRANEKKFTI